jgi:FlaA1/EpsC-like NDP-sugar epimerase
VNSVSVPRRVPAPTRWRAGGPTTTALAFLAADVAAWASASSVVYLMRAAIWREAPFLWITWSVFLVWFLLRLGAGFYQVPRVSQAFELRRSVLVAGTAIAIHGALLLAAGEISTLRLFALLVWPLLLPIDWVLRSVVRSGLIRARLFGYPVVVLGTGVRLRRIVQELDSNRDIGLVPIAAFDTDPARWGSTICGVPVLGSLDSALTWEGPHPVRRAVIAMDDDARSSLSPAFAHQLAKRFPTLGIVTELGGVANLWARPRPVGTYLALEIPHARATAP